MQTFQLLILVLKNLPAILKLLEILQKAELDMQNQRKIDEDLAKINEAFEAKDAEKLKQIFSS